MTREELDEMMNGNPGHAYVHEMGSNNKHRLIYI